MGSIVEIISCRNARKLEGRKMNWVQRKIYLYNVTFGLYMLDWWERCLFNILVLVLLWFMCYNGFRFAFELFNRQMW
ncbi:uncharacterized protein LOC129873121 isoform X2 [Solanum dulcamara]|uniref:uncharacterized protein LOC129873121 isoform X2 n=1 Tax=Solanum dulcamara TaxID=45834 RepID=UPI0024852F54|nr:uncharacterized protein LOC129873121 isoform X2 [Solanum dulcamara]